MSRPNDGFVATYCNSQSKHVYQVQKCVSGYNAGTVFRKDVAWWTFILSGEYRVTSCRLIDRELISIGFLPRCNPILDFFYRLCIIKALSFRLQMPPGAQSCPTFSTPCRVISKPTHLHVLKTAEQGTLTLWKCKWSTPWRGMQTSQWRSLLPECHRGSRYAGACNSIYAHKAVRPSARPSSKTHECSTACAVLLYRISPKSVKIFRQHRQELITK